MDINRDNYEEYFLLYADNELTDSEKAQVLMFLKDNKDLEDEFKMIHATITKPDKRVELVDKSFLFKNDAAAFINENNYEEIFVLYYDNELTEEQKQDTKQFLSVHPKLKDEFELIGLARLTPESSIGFQKKKLLYRKEKTGKVIPVRFWRMLAAAIFIGFGLWVTYSNFKTSEKTIATNTKSNSPNSVTLPVKKNNLPEKQIFDTVAHNQVSNYNNEKEGQEKKSSAKNNSNNIIAKINYKKQEKNIEENLKLLSQNTNSEVAKNNQEIKDISTEKVTAINTIVPAKETGPNVAKEDSVKDNPPVYAQTASYIQDVDTKNENYVFYDIPTDKFKKTKVGGFLKKVKRVIERNNPIAQLLSADDRQVVSK